MQIDEAQRGESSADAAFRSFPFLLSSQKEQKPWEMINIFKYAENCLRRAEYMIQTKVHVVESQGDTHQQVLHKRKRW